jgi:hypothetical protein
MPKTLQHENRLQLAIEALNSGQIKRIKVAAATFDVPYSTLQNRLQGRVSRQQSQVGHRKLHPTEETAPIRRIESMDDRGMSPTIGYIRQMADLLIRERGGSVLLDTSVAATAANDTVGEKWVRRFLDR